MRLILSRRLYWGHCPFEARKICEMLHLGPFYPVYFCAHNLTVRRGSYCTVCNGSFTFPEMDSGKDSDWDSKLDGYIVLCRTFHIAQIQNRIPTPYFFCIGQESESVPESVSGNVNEP